MTINEMVTYTGLTKAAFARIYKIPIRTLEDWTSGKKRPRNDYVFYLLERAVRYDKEMKVAKTEEDIQNLRHFIRRNPNLFDGTEKTSI